MVTRVSQEGELSQGLELKVGFEVKGRDARDSGKSGQGAEQVDNLGVRDLRRETALTW